MAKLRPNPLEGLQTGLGTFSHASLTLSLQDPFPTGSWHSYCVPSWSPASASLWLAILCMTHIASNMEDVPFWTPNSVLMCKLLEAAAMTHPPQLAWIPRSILCPESDPSKEEANRPSHLMEPKRHFLKQGYLLISDFHCSTMSESISRGWLVQGVIQSRVLVWRRERVFNCAWAPGKWHQVFKDGSEGLQASSPLFWLCRLRAL